jgi:hypothetical protein
MTRDERSEMSDHQYDEYLKEMNSKKILVAVGLHDHDKNYLTADLYVVSNFSFHQSFSMDPCCQDDISILRLEKNVSINNKVNTICLPFSLNNFKNRIHDLGNNDPVIVAGWGRLTDSSNEHAFSLKEAVLRVKIRDEICDASKFWKTGTVYCLNDDVKNSTVCNADSGELILQVFKI